MRNHRPNRLRSIISRVAEIEINRHLFQKIILTFIKKFLISSVKSYFMAIRTWGLIIDISSIKIFFSFRFDPQLPFFLSLNLLFIGLTCTNADQKLQSQSSPDLLSPGSMFFSLIVPNKGSKFSLACDVFCGKESLFCVPLYVSSSQINFRKHKNASWAKAYWYRLLAIVKMSSFHSSCRNISISSSPSRVFDSTMSSELDDVLNRICLLLSSLEMLYDVVWSQIHHTYSCNDSWKHLFSKDTHQSP